MATLQITIPDAILARVLDAVAAANGYDPASGLTKAQFARNVLARLIKDMVKSQEATQALITARDTAAANAESQITIT